MESRIQHFLVAVGLAASLAAAPTLGADTSDIELEPLLVREPERREVRVDQIDRENFEIGVFGGVMSVEDFGSNPVYGLRLDYHVTEDFFVEAAYARTELGLTSFERLSGGAQILDGDDRDMTFYNLSVGWNVLPGEAFVTRRLAFRGGLYLMAGAGATDFGGDQRFTVNGGIGYRFVATDWLSFRLDVRDHVFTTDLLGADETKHNFELSGGVTVFF